VVRLEKELQKCRDELDKVYENYDLDEWLSEDFIDSEVEEEDSGWIETLEENCSKILESDSDSHRLFGLDIAEFNTLVSDYNASFLSLSWRSTRRKRKSFSRDLDPAMALKITLYWMRQYHTMICLKRTFGVEERTLARVFKRVLTALEVTFQEELKWPSDNELLSWKHPDNENTARGYCLFRGWNDPSITAEPLIRNVSTRVAQHTPLIRHSRRDPKAPKKFSPSDD